MIRLIIFGVIIVVIYFFIKRILNPSEFITCERCAGKGFWYAARGKENCDWCKGSGKMPREK